MYAILFEDMSPRAPKPPKQRLAPDPVWLQRLADLWTHAVEIGRLERPKTKSTASRARNALTSSVSYDAIERTRLSVLKALPDENIPPPYASVRDQEDWEWISVGRRLRAADPEYARQLLLDLADIIATREEEAALREARENAERRLREKTAPGSTPIAKPARPRTI
jgi:hypothetical protein